MVDQFLEAVERVDGNPVALIVPHAGYIYSGQVAAYGFKQLEEADIDTAIIIASDHQPPISGPISVWIGDGFETPLGIVPVNWELAELIVDSNPLIHADHLPHNGEHPIEIELPFLQRVCPTCSIVPILMGKDDPDTVSALANTLSTLLIDRKAVIIASSDLSHYPSYEDARIIDGATLAAIETGDLDFVTETINALMSSGFSNLVTCACGKGPILVAMHAAESLGANSSTVLGYLNSGDIPLGEVDRVVGYGAVMFWQYEPPNITESDQEELLEFARKTLEAHLDGSQLPTFKTENPNLLRRSGVFVTVEQDGELRGCIGHVRADLPLYQAVQDMSISAATLDPRFPPLTKEELSTIEIEISVLSPLQRVTDNNQIEVGIHGLILYHSDGQGLLLPQVAIEQGWDRESLLENLCLKAGLPENCWRENPSIYSFTAIVFAEE